MLKMFFSFAEPDSFNFNLVPSISHHFVSDTTEKWWWIFNRGYSNANWHQVCDTLLTRVTIWFEMREVSCNKMSFSKICDFALEIEFLNCIHYLHLFELYINVTELLYYTFYTHLHSIDLLKYWILVLFHYGAHILSLYSLNAVSNK